MRRCLEESSRASITISAKFITSSISNQKGARWRISFCVRVAAIKAVNRKS
jgi:hypothetical protein